MITAAVVRDERIRGAFTVIAWINLSQQPDIMSLQLRLYEQLSKKNESIPTKHQNSAEHQLDALQKVAIGQTALIILDDIWDSNHESVRFLFLFRRPGFIRFYCQAFACHDEKTASRLLVTTRIKGKCHISTNTLSDLLNQPAGILRGGNEVELDLLGLSSSIIKQLLLKRRKCKSLILVQSNSRLARGSRIAGWSC